MQAKNRVLSSLVNLKSRNTRGDKKMATELGLEKRGIAELLFKNNFNDV